MGPAPVNKQVCDWWAVNGTFQADVRLNPALSETERERYEYRQYISGTALLQPGSWGGGRSQWNPTNPPTVRDVGASFEIPDDPATGQPKGLTRQW